MPKLLKYALVAFLSAAIFAPTAFAAEPYLTDEQRGAISQHCSTTKQSLHTLQRTDARTRSYLGSLYEDLLSHYITPLNLRLVSAGLPNTNLTTIHSDIIETRQKFISEYTSYSQALEELISIDCQSRPDDFYAQLLKTRERRSALSTTTTNLRNLFSEHLTAVKRLRTNLEGGNNETE